MTFGTVQIERHERMSTICMAHIDSFACAIHVLVVNNSRQAFSAQHDIFKQLDRLGLKEIFYVEPLVRPGVRYDIVVHDWFEPLQVVDILDYIADDRSRQDEEERKLVPESGRFFVSGRRRDCF